MTDILKQHFNGLDIPGLDPDRNSLQMDIFPTNIVDNIIVSKSFTADLPADFTGGVIDINIKSFPEIMTLKGSSSISYNNKVDLNGDFLTYYGGETDYLAHDDGSRDFPLANKTTRCTDCTRSENKSGNYAKYSIVQSTDGNRKR